MPGASSSRQKGPSSANNEKFRELDVLRMVGDNCTTKGIISQRMQSGVITFSIVREFSRDGVTEWTSYFSERQLDDFEKMLHMIKARIVELRADPNVLPVRTAETR